MGQRTYTSTKSPICARARRRVSSYGEMAALITATPWRVSSEHTKAMRRMLVSRSSREKPRPLERWVRTTSPSRTSTPRPRAHNSVASCLAMVVLPAPERPVNQTVNPLATSSSSSHTVLTSTHGKPMPLVYIRHSDHSCASVHAVVFQGRRRAVTRPRHGPPAAVLGLRPGQRRWGLQTWDGPQEQVPIRLLAVWERSHRPLLTQSGVPQAYGGLDSAVCTGP